jgi:chromosome segregation ATPase
MGSNVSLDFALPLKLLKHPLVESIEELRQGYQSLSECVEQAAAECEQRGAELADCRRQLAEARRSLIEQEKVLDERAKAEAESTRRSQALKKQLDAAQSELAQVNEKLMRAQADELQSRQRLEVQVEHNQQLQSQIERIQSDADQSRGELAQLRAQFAPLTEATVDAARLRGELATAQADAAALRGQLAAKADQPDLGPQLAEALAQRQQVESELDQLRHRAAELADELAEQKRVMADQREQWSDELRLLRRAVDRQSELLVHRGGPPNLAAPAVAHSEPASVAPAKGDQVMDTVLQQFEMLQKSKVRKMAKTAR